MKKFEDLICFSHLRWGFVFQRPQHLMSRFARNHRVFYFEEPVFEAQGPKLRVELCPATQVHVCTPVLKAGLSRIEVMQQQQVLLDSFFVEKGATANYVSWYYTPMAREFSRHLEPVLTVYDCMDELSAFAGAPIEMVQNEAELFEAADLVFTGGASLYEAKRRQHAAVYLFPSSVDVQHFAKARLPQAEPAVQANIPQPRIGYAGVIDERMDLTLLESIARQRPDWQFVMIGPIVKIDDHALPQRPNIHYLGMQAYKDLPAFFSGWTIGMLPFALNASTRYISPTKTPEYLAAGLQVISTPIQDVVTPYGDLRLAGIANSPDEFIRIADSFISSPLDQSRRQEVDAQLARNSWDKTWAGMYQHMADTLNQKLAAVTAAVQIKASTVHV